MKTNPAIYSKTHLALVEQLKETFHDMRKSGIQANAYSTIKMQAHTRALDNLRYYLDTHGFPMPDMKYPHLANCCES